MSGTSEDGRRRHHRRGPADLRGSEPPEEGELVPDRDDSDMDTDDYYNNHDYYSSSDDTDETTSDCNYAHSVVPSSSAAATGPSSSSSAAAAKASNNGNAASSSPTVVAAPVPPAVLACPVCGKEFRSRKAVCGHMKVHQQGTAIGRRHEQQQQQQGIGKDSKGIKRGNAAVAGGWGGTGKRGSSGCWSKPASPNAQSSDQSMAIVVANPDTVLQPMPLAFAAPNPLPVHMESATPNNQSSSAVPMASATPNPSSVPIASTTTNVSDESSSAKPMRSDAMETVVVAGAANPPTEAVVQAPPPAEAPGVRNTQSVHQQPIAPPLPPGAEEDRVHLPPAVHHPPHPIAPPLAVAVAGRQNPNGYTCRQCGVWFPTHQGLGGHMAGHKTRELAAGPCRRDANKPEKVHACRMCAAVFPTGVQLGGHMRKHYAGAPIVPKKKPRLDVQPLPPPAEQGALGPAPRPAVAGTVRLFGVDIVAGAAQTPAAQAQEEGSSAIQAPSASTGGEQ